MSAPPMSPGALVLLSLLSLSGVSRERPVRLACERGVISYRFEAAPGTPITYEGVTHRVGATGVLELLANGTGTAIRIGSRTYALPLAGKPDRFGVLVVRLRAR